MMFPMYCYYLPEESEHVYERLCLMQSMLNMPASLYMTACLTLSSLSY